MLNSRSSMLILIAVGFLVAVGCSPQGSNVSGTVTFEGKPLPDAKITFYAEGVEPQTSYAAKSDEQGNYELLLPEGAEGPKPGSYAVTVIKVVPKKGAKITEDQDLDQLEAAGLVTNSLPRQFGRIESTPLKVTVESGTNDIPLKLTQG